MIKFRWGKMLRQSLKSNARGKIYFQDKLKEENFFLYNFGRRGLSIDLDDPKVIKTKLTCLKLIEELFNPNNTGVYISLYCYSPIPRFNIFIDKMLRVTHKTFSLEYGRKVVHSKLVLPLLISYDIESKTITFEASYEVKIMTISSNN
jgi:hypothetical protein